MKKHQITFLILSIFIISAFGSIDADIENKNVDRTIDITSQLVKISYKITLDHKGKNNINSYEFVVPESERDNLAFIIAKDASKKEIKFTEGKSKYGVTFTMAIPGNSPNPTIYIDTVLTKSLKPYPTHITQSERQLVRYFGNLYFYSPYKTVSQKTTVLLSSRSIESYTLVKPYTQSDTSISYGPYDNIAGLY